MKENSIQYITLNVNLLDNSKIERLMFRHGVAGFGLWVCILLKTAGNDGYYMEWDDERINIFSGKILCGSMSFEEMKKVTESMVEIGLFDRDTIEQFRVLTSKSIQSRWSAVKSKSHAECNCDKYWMISEEEANLKPTQNENKTKKSEPEAKLSEAKPKKSEATANNERNKTKVELGKERREEERKEEDTLSSAGACETKFSDSDAMRVVGIWNDVFQGTDQFYDAINVNQITLFRIKQRLERGTSDEEFRRVFEKAKNRTDFGWTLPMVFNKEDNFDQIRARKERHNNSPVRESGYSDQRNYNHLYSAKGSNEPLPARYTEEVTI